MTAYFAHPAFGRLQARVDVVLLPPDANIIGSNLI